MKEFVYSRLLFEAAGKCTHVPAYIAGDVEVCMCAHTRRVQALVAGMRRNGLPGSSNGCFAVLSRNNLEFVMLWHAAMLGVAVLNPLNWRLAPAELEYVLRDSGATVLFVETQFLDLAQRLRGVAPGLTIVTVDAVVDGYVSLVDLIDLDDLAEEDEPDENAILTIMYTGGTTGNPKGVVLTHRAFVLGLYRAAFAYDHFSHTDRFLQISPLFHASSISGAHIVPLSGGTTVIKPGFDAGQFLADVEGRRLTSAAMVPTMMAMVLNHPSYRPERLRSLRMIGYGGSPITRSVLDRWVEDQPQCALHQIYGSTEIGGLATVLRGDEHRSGADILNSAGRSLPGIRLSIQDLAGTAVATGELGEICIKSGSVMLRYNNAPELTAEAFRNGWYRSGDIGRLDDNGYLYVVDRLKDMIVSGGENIYSAEVENALAAHPLVTEAAVIGVPHPVWGEAVHAVVVSPSDSVLDADELIAHCRTFLAGYKVPKSVEIRSTPLPISAANKVVKRALRDEHAAARSALTSKGRP